MTKKEKKETEELTTELYLVLCRTNKLTYDDMEMMTIGMCLEYIETYNEVHHPLEVSLQL
ncbi:MAG: hypothetical protein KBT36_14160 [Kurthia sp.]|nr:hypothetical protein [Candidatus Kurthia equi]